MPGMRWVAKGNLHFTLKFLGPIDDLRIEPIGRALELAVRPFPRFTINAKGLGVFPNVKRPQVLWVELEGRDVISLASRVECALEPLGFRPEERDFKPHLTVGRWRHFEGPRARLREEIERQFGKGAIMKLGEGGLVKDVPIVSTGSLGLDIALGIGGVPRGRVIEIYGPESSGKTTLALQIVAEAQKQGGMGAFIDAEHALDLGYAKKLGVKTDDLLVSQPDHGEQALEIAETLVRSGAIDVLTIDSVAALVPKAEIEGEMGDAHMGLQARLMSQALRKLTATISRSQTVVIFINQIRMKIGVMFGNPETTTGGNALKFYASVRMDIRRIGALKEG